MIKFVNKTTGGPMWVHESRVEEYLAAGHSLAAPPPPKHPLQTEEKKAAPKRKQTKR